MTSDTPPERRRRVVRKRENLIKRLARTCLAGFVAAICSAGLVSQNRARGMRELSQWEATPQTEIYPENSKNALNPSENRSEDRADQRAKIAADLFRYQARATALDLYSTGHITVSRAKRLSFIIVKEARLQRVPIPLVVGVIRVENTTFLSEARSIVGARGLMQIMPSVWLPTLGQRHGWDLTDDNTNIGMGVHILAYYLKNADGDWRNALLRYNGCVRGATTPRCGAYPDLVRRAVERDAKWLCRGKDFNTCLFSAGSLETKTDISSYSKTE